MRSGEILLVLSVECGSASARAGPGWEAVGAESCTACEDSCFFSAHTGNVIPNPRNLLLGHGEETKLENFATWLSVSG